MARGDNPGEGTLPRTGIDETELDRKVWWRIIPFVAILLLICIIDRVNIGYAALTMNAELGIDPAFFGFISGIFLSVILSARFPATSSSCGPGHGYGSPGS